MQSPDERDKFEQIQVGWGFWLFWVLYSLLSGGLGLGAGLFLVVIGGGYAGLVAVAFGMGIAQWLVLRMYVSQVRRWMLVNAVAIFLLFVVTTRLFLSPVGNRFPSVDTFADLLFSFTWVLAVYVPLAASALVWMIKNNTTTRTRVLISVAGIVSGVLIGWLIDLGLQL
jgi:hypothetical protein